ncbi:MAG: peroxiredoxin [Promethearchaeota archaeon]
MGRITLPDHFSGRWFVLFTHPADFTPICTTEFVGFAKRHEQFREMNCELVGLSIDQVFAHIKWLEWIEAQFDVRVEFPVIADNYGHVVRRLNFVHPERQTSPLRGLMIVDHESTIRLTMTYPIELGRNLDEVLRAVRGLQLATREGVALPANWPNNEVVGDHVLLPVPRDRTTADSRLRETSEWECFDWWFCHRPPAGHSSRGGDEEAR